MPKKKKETQSKSEKNAKRAVSPSAEMSILTLAHEGTKESLDKISDYIIHEKDKDKRILAQFAYDEAEFNYYSPRNEKEEKEFLLAKMIHERDERLIGLMVKANSAKFELQQLDADRRVHERVMVNLKKQKKNQALIQEWQYRFSEDYYKMEAGRLHELEDDINYESEWLKQARAVVTTKRFTEVPDDFWRHIHWNGEGSAFWTDNLDETDDEYDEYGECPPKDEEDIPF